LIDLILLELIPKEEIIKSFIEKSDGIGALNEIRQVNRIPITIKFLKDLFRFV
jgi:hypothetical protein